MRKNWKNYHWLCLSLAVLTLDQATKSWVNRTLLLHQPVELLPIFNLTLAYNTGAAFSFLHQASGWQQALFAGIAFTVSGFIVYWLYQLPPYKKLEACGLSLILGGAMGNLVDRISRGYVIDFLDVHWQQYHWPVFNVADSAITIGAVLYLIAIWRK